MDVGAHDGQTLAEVTRRDRYQFDQIHALEPMPVQFANLVAAYSDNPWVTLHPFGLDVEGAEAEILTDAGEFIHGLGVPLLVSLHAPLRPDPIEYLRLIHAALVPFEWERVGEDGAFPTILARPR